MDVLQHTDRRRGAGLMYIQILRRFRVAPDESAAFDRSVVGKRRAGPEASAEYAAADQRSSRCKEFSTLHDTTPPSLRIPTLLASTVVREVAWLAFADVPALAVQPPSYEGNPGRAAATPS